MGRDYVSLVPVAGTYLAGILPILIALLHQPISALWVLIAIVVYHSLRITYSLPHHFSNDEYSPSGGIRYSHLGAALLGVVGTL